MIVHSFEPPSVQTTGGLSLAIRSLKGSLERSGIEVGTNSAIKELGQSGAEVVHFHGIWQFGFLKVSAYCRRQGIPYVVSPHGMLEPWAFKHKWWKKWPYFYLAEKRHLTGARALVATSDLEANNLGKLFPASKRVVLPLGITELKQPDYFAARASLGWGDSETIFLFLSRIHPKKGLHLLLSAFTRIAPELNRSARLVIVGGGEESYLRKLKSFAGENSSRLPRIDWVGEIWTEEKWKYLQGANLFCLPSYSENFGLAVLETLQVGTPVLTTNQTPWGAIPSWEAGYVVEPTESALRDVLAMYLNSPPRWDSERRRRLAEKIREQFSWDTIGPAYLRLYDEVIRGGGS